MPNPLFLYVHDKGQIRNIMKRNISNTILTKDYIFSKVSQITIFSTYTGISVEDIQHCIDTGEFISSPFREDTHPSFGFRYDNRNKLKGRDFAGYWWGMYRDWETDRKSTRLNSSHITRSRMPSSA